MNFLHYNDSRFVLRQLNHAVVEKQSYNICRAVLCNFLVKLLQFNGNFVRFPNKCSKLTDAKTLILFTASSEKKNHFFENYISIPFFRPIYIVNSIPIWVYICMFGILYRLI